MRLIDADKALRMIRMSKEDNPYLGKTRQSYAWKIAHDSAISCVEACDTIEEEPAKHGRWLPQVLLGARVWDCSECKTMGSPHWKRCPVCEAKMDLGGC